jgi:Pao retrotransposon peptidase
MKLISYEEEDIDEVTLEEVTKRMVWRVAQAQYDPLGLISPFMIQFKLVMRSLCSEEGKVTGWDESIPGSRIIFD